MSIINISTAGEGGEESDVQCTGSNKLHCCKQIQNGESAANDICASYNCGLDIQCDDDNNNNNNNNSEVSRILNNDGDSWHRWYKPTNSWSKPSGGWNSKVSKSLCFIVSKLVHSHLYNKGFSHVVRLSCHYNDFIRSHQTNGPVGTTSLVDGIASQVAGASQVAAGIAGQR